MPEKFVEKYKKSPTGLLYVAPTGYGKTRKAICATRGEPTSVVGTSSLTRNFAREERKAFGTQTRRYVDTYAGLARTHILPGGKHLILDESHYIRNPQTKTFLKLKRERGKYDKALLMTATPIINEPYDIASQINLVAREQVVPIDKVKFYEKYYKDRAPSLSFIARARGVKKPYSRALKDPRQVRATVGPHMFIKTPKSVEALLPKREETIVSVPMTEKQQKIYNYIAGQLPYSMRYKIKKGLPPSKQESKGLNAYLSGLRQVSNTTRSFQVDDVIDSPKLKRIVADLKGELKKKGKVLVYSNFLESGINEIRRHLDRDKISYSYIIGSMSKGERAKQIDKYNKGITKVMLLSGAGAEGINLPNTSMVQLTEPHWNMARLYQASSRGIRRSSKRETVPVYTYISSFPQRKFRAFGVNWFTYPKKRSAGEYLLGLSRLKEQESKEFLRAVMPELG